MRNAMTFGRGALPRIRWGAIAAGVLCALAIHIVLGLLGMGLGFAADPADSKGLGVLATLWGLLVPIAASFAGAYVATRIAASLHPSSGMLHGVLVWCVGLIAGALFLAGAAGGLASGLGDRSDAGTSAQTEQASERAAAASALGGVAALFGLGGALAGAMAGRKAMLGDISELGYQRERGVAAKGPAPESIPLPSRRPAMERPRGNSERGLPRNASPGPQRNRGEDWRRELNSPTRH